MNDLARRWALALILSLPLSTVTAPTEPCWDFSGLDSVHAHLAEQILQGFTDREGLYTIAGGLKPITSGPETRRAMIRPVPDSTALARIDSWRHVVPMLTCGPLSVHLHHYRLRPEQNNPADTMMTVTLVVMHRHAVSAELRRHAPFWNSLGLTPASSPEEILHAVEHADRAARWRGYGYLFGYPAEAVDFFVAAGLEGDSTSTLVPRDFRTVETFLKFPVSASGDSLRSHFVYAVPRGAGETANDRLLRERAAPIYREYLTLRAHTDVTPLPALLRSWWRVTSQAPALTTLP
jgi:hypothetical protein